MNCMGLWRQQPGFIAVIVVNAITNTERKRVCISNTDTHTEIPARKVMFYTIL